MVCGTKLSASEGLAGRRVECPQCGRHALVPGGNAAAVENSQAPERNLFLASSKWERVYGRPVTRFESRILNAFHQITGKRFNTDYPFEPFEMSQAIKAYAPLVATELVICKIWNTTGAIFGDSTAGIIVTTQGAYWRNTDGGTRKIVFCELEPDTAVATTGVFSRYATIAEQRMDFPGDNEALKALVEFLNVAIELANDDPASIGPTENAIGGAMAARASQHEQAFRAFLQRHIRSKTFLAAGLALWPSPRVEHIRDAFEQDAYFDELVDNRAPVLPRVFDVGIVGVTASELCFYTLVKDARALKEIEVAELLASKPAGMVLKAVPRVSIKSRVYPGAEMSILILKGTKRNEIRFPAVWFHDNKANAERIAAFLAKA